MRAHDLRRGAMLMIGSALMFALMGAAVKVASRTLSSAEVVFFRCALGLLVLLPWVAPLGLAGLRTSRPREHLIRGVAGLGTMACFFYFGLVSTVLSAVPAALSWRTPRGPEWWLLIAIGGFGSVGQLLLTAAYAHAPAARVGPFIYSSVVFAGLLEWALWRSVPDGLSFAGMILVAGAGVLALRIGAEAPQPAPAA